jgi:hypothetical protein
MAESNVPILIVGGGPVGLSASLLLSRHGVRSLLVERHQGTSIVPKPRRVNVVKMVREYGPLRKGLDDESAADIIWILNDPGLYHQLVLQRGWKPERFRAWVAGAMRTQLLATNSAEGARRGTR